MLNLPPLGAPRPQLNLDALRRTVRVLRLVTCTIDALGRLAPSGSTELTEVGGDVAAADLFAVVVAELVAGLVQIYPDSRRMRLDLVGLAMFLEQVDPRPRPPGPPPSITILQ